MTIQRLHIALTAAALAVTVIGLDLAFTEAGFAAKRTKQVRAATPQTQNSTRPPYHPQGTSRYPWGEGYNLPYPDRPYGDPGRW
jgi:hypothetical protein